MSSQLSFIQREQEKFSDFNTFWEFYPRKVSKPFAWKAWKLMPLADRRAAIEGIWKVAGVELKFIPYPATYLHGRRWEDEVQKPEPYSPDGVAAGPQVVESPACARCGRTKLFHSLRPQGRKNIDRMDDGHSYEAPPSKPSCKTP